VFIIKPSGGIAEFAGLEIAGLENDIRSRKCGMYRTAKMTDWKITD